MGVRLYDGSDLTLFILVGWYQSSFVCCLVRRSSTDDLHLLQNPSGVVCQTKDLHLSRKTPYLLSSRLSFFIVLKRDFMDREDSLTKCLYHINYGG